MKQKEELQKLKEERDQLLRKCERLTKEAFVIKEQYHTLYQIKRLEENNIKIINEKIERLQKEIYKPKIHRIKPLEDGRIYIEVKINQDTTRSMIISRDTYPCDRFLFLMETFLQAYMSVCGSKICWAAALHSPICIDIEKILDNN